jgi:hypothetical protein
MNYWLLPEGRCPKAFCLENKNANMYIIQKVPPEIAR